jgi:hypothetical protein
MVNLLSSPHAVWELLGQQPLPNKAEYNLREMLPINNMGCLKYFKM